MMLSDHDRADLLDVLAAWERVTHGKSRTDLEGEQEIISGLIAVNDRITELCQAPTGRRAQPWAYTPLDTARPDPEAEGGIRYRAEPG